MREIAQVFFKLGLFGFGGPIATIAMMEEETSRKRGWVSADRFAEMYSVCKILPGPVATQMAIYLGLLRGGKIGGLISGSLFILPSFVMVLALSALYFGNSSVEKPQSLFQGLQAGALAVIVFSVIQLARPYYKKTQAWVVALASLIAVLVAPRYEPLVILCFGLLGAKSSTRWSGLHSFFPAIGFVGGLPSISAALESKLAQLFWVCFKAGAFVFGTGLAIVPLLETDTVERFAWLTHAEFMDGLAIGQITPGPVVITATFIGYKTAGLTGALVATAGIFLPAFVNVLFIVPRLWEKLSGTPAAAGFVRFAIPAVIGGILGTLVKLVPSTLQTVDSGLIFAIAVASAWRFKIPGWVLIPAAGVVSFFLGFAIRH